LIENKGAHPASQQHYSLPCAHCFCVHNGFYVLGYGVRPVLSAATQNNLMGKFQFCSAVVDAIGTAGV
jgi:hypothetical protein